jgi:hypothetical protein
VKTTIIKFGLVALLARVVLGLFFVAVQASSPGEGAMILLLDLPTLAAEFASSSLTGWPEGITDAYDITFHVFGVITWFLLGCLVGSLIARYRSGRPQTSL